jgi:hypothetical protein
VEVYMQICWKIIFNIEKATLVTFKCMHFN